MPRIKMQESAGVVGEDGTDWLGGTEHDASDHFAAYLITHGKAYTVSTAPRAVTPGIANSDPAVEARDPHGLDTVADAAIVTPASPRNRKR